MNLLTTPTTAIVTASTITPSGLRSIVTTAFPEYRGRKIRSDFSGRVTFANLNWSEGRRDEFVSVHLADGQTRDLSVPAPWRNPVEGVTVQIPAGIAVVELQRFGGSQSVTVHFAVAQPLPASGIVKA